MCAGVLLLNSPTKQDLHTPTKAGLGWERIVTLWTWAHVPEAYDGARVVGLDRLTSAASDPTDHPALPIRIDVALRFDPLTAIMLVMVNFVALLVAIYAAGYMRGDRGYSRFFAFVSLFVFSMNMLVTASNFLQLFVFWEAVGVCSYLLIGFWYQRPAAAAAGQKAFLVNRVGDFGFALAMFLIWLTYGTLDFHDSAAGSGVLGQARLAAGAYAGGGLGLSIGLLLMFGACGKSAQWP
ncbi:MAG TPA: proton-conducting transporter membrane subunit, partial [Pirellulaceae bacterium]